MNGNTLMNMNKAPFPSEHALIRHKKDALYALTVMRNYECMILGSSLRKSTLNQSMNKH